MTTTDARAAPGSHKKSMAGIPLFAQGGHGKWTPKKPRGLRKTGAKPRFPPLQTRFFCAKKTVLGLYRHWPGMRARGEDQRGHDPSEGGGAVGITKIIKPQYLVSQTTTPG